MTSRVCSPVGRRAAIAVSLSLALAWSAAPQRSAAAKPATPVSGLRVLELAVEAAAADVALPADGSGRLTVKPCPACAPVALVTGAATRSLVDGAPVSLEVLRRTLATEADASVAVFYRRASGEVTRILVTLPAASSRR